MAILLFIPIYYETIYDLELPIDDKTGGSVGSASTDDVVIKEEGAATSIKKMQAWPMQSLKNKQHGCLIMC